MSPDRKHPNRQRARGGGKDSDLYDLRQGGHEHTTHGQAFRWKDKHPANSVATSLNLRAEYYSFSIVLPDRFPLIDFQNKCASGKLVNAGETGKADIPEG
jgi:hypothetical protein